MRSFIAFVLMLFVVFLFFSCKKKEDKIVGKWEYVYLTSADTGKIQTWEFKSDKSFIRNIALNDTVLIDTASYSFESRIIDSPNLKINELHPDLDGTYEILTLNKKFLIIQRILLSDGSSQGAFLRAEFVKK